MNLNELIEKYKEEIEENEKYKKADISYRVFYDRDIEIYEEMLSDLEQLKTVAKESLECDTDTDCLEYFKNYVIGE